MKKLIELWYRFTDKDFDTKLESAKITTKMIMASTIPPWSHFQDKDGNKIRGWSNTQIKTIVKNHPLIEKYC